MTSALTNADIVQRLSEHPQGEIVHVLVDGEPLRVITGVGDIAGLNDSIIETVEDGDTESPLTSDELLGKLADFEPGARAQLFYVDRTTERYGYDEIQDAGFGYQRGTGQYSNPFLEAGDFISGG